MDYEKKYNDALAWMRELYPGLHGATKEDAEHYFPELRESEDERVRALLVSLVQWAEIFPQSGLDSDTTNKMLSYLEKQKEQKPAQQNSEEVFNKIDSSFRKGREVGFREGMKSVKPAEWSEEDKQWLESIIREYEERLSVDKDHAAVIQVKIDLLKSFRPQPKQEWSTRDKKILQSLHHVMNCADAQNAVKRDGLSVADVCNFLFSIEPSWKPSEEQMEAFRSVLEHEAERVGSSKHLEKANSLYEQLKKL